tara:strand:+ start:613 stop:867 length:255 start_codon:yes stop_codon:yes gene_type:complete
MSAQNITDLRNNTLSTVAAVDEENAVGSIFVGWQEGFEQSYIEVQFCNLMPYRAQDAIAIAEERMKELNRGQDNDSDIVVTRLF